MTWIIRAELLSPVCLTENRGVGNVIPSLDYIPGTTLRGALAARWLKLHGYPPNNKFRELFLSGQASFPNLYPQAARVIPRSALTCKYKPGFRGEQAHGVKDAVLPWLRYKLGIVSTLQKEVEECWQTDCLAGREPLEGFFGKERGLVTRKPAAKRLLARTAILGSRQVAKSGDLYSLEVLSEGQQFEGTFLGTDQLAQELEALINKGNHFLLGYSRSRGLGEVKLRFLEKKAEARTSLAERLRQFNQKLHGQEGQVTHFILTLESDTIVLDELLEYRRHPEGTDLAEAAGEGPGGDILKDCRFYMGWLQAVRVSGWQAAWQMPKGEEQAIAKGSVLVYQLPSEFSSSRIDELAAALQRLEGRGLGERPAEGFGRLRVCDEFHWEQERL